MKIVFIPLIAMLLFECKKEAVAIQQTKVINQFFRDTSVVTSKIKMDSIAVNNYNVKANDNIDDSQTIQKLIKSNEILFFPKGIYDISTFLKIDNITNLTICGETGTIFKTSQNDIFQVTGNIKKLEFQNLKLLSVNINSTNDPGGLLFIANYGTNDLMDSISIHDCTFTNPTTHANAIKLVSEGANSLVKNISITKNTFTSVGRFAVEFQNHNAQPVLARFRDYNISNNYFFDVGTIQLWPAPCCISVSGYALNGKIDNNIILDMRMNTSSYVYYGIENAGTIGLETIGNFMKSTTFGFTGILGDGPTPQQAATGGAPVIRNWIIQSNTFNLTGSAIDKGKIRGIDLGQIFNYSITKNTINTDGAAIKFSDCANGKIINNRVKVKSSGYGFYFQTGSTANEITLNTLDCSQGPEEGVIFFIGKTTTGNIAYNNKMIKTGGLPGSYVNYDGAYNNTK